MGQKIISLGKARFLLWVDFRKVTNLYTKFIIYYLQEDYLPLRKK